MKFLDYPADAVKDRTKPVGNGRALDPDAAGSHVIQVLTLLVNNPVTGHPGSGIDADDTGHPGYPPALLLVELCKDIL